MQVDDPSAIYAPADFPDIEQRNHSIVQTVSNVTLYHISDGTEKHQQSRVWRRKVRDILQNHQERILQFFSKPLPENHPIKVAQTLLTKYGKPLSNFDPSKNPPQFLKDYIQDVSGSGFVSLNTYLNELMEGVRRTSECSTSRWITMTRHMLDHMRDVGDELIRLDQKLSSACTHLDWVVESILQFSNLPHPDIDGFQEMMELYIKRQFDSHPIEQYYWDYIHTLQKYSGLRDILIPQRTANLAEPICCICMTEPIIMAMVPCGHTFCTNCSKRTIVCHICRKQVTSRMRIYFG